MLGEAGFRKAILLERSVGMMMVYHVAPIVECVAKGLTMLGHRGFCEKEKARGVLVQHRNDVD